MALVLGLGADVGRAHAAAAHSPRGAATEHAVHGALKIIVNILGGVKLSHVLTPVIKSINAMLKILEVNIHILWS